MSFRGAKPGAIRLSRRREVVALFGFGLALGLFPAVNTPRAEAAFPGRNGDIVIAILRPPFTSIASLENTLHMAADRDLFIVSPDGSGLRQITEGADYADLAPSWSADGKKIVFTRVTTIRGVLGGDIWIINADGTGAQNLTNTPQVFEWAPSWSPDGKRIVFSSDRAQPDVQWRVTALGEPELDLYIMDPDGENLVRLTSDAGAEGEPAWSPDGRLIAFQHHQLITVMHPDGTGRRILTKEVQGATAQWSPDGRRLVFKTSTDSEMWIINVDGSGLRNLAPRDPARSTRPTWSPDGRWIAFVSDRDGSWNLYRMRPDGSDVRKLIDLDLESPFSSPDWGPRP